MPFVSVIVPAFNAEVTIEKIIRDILAQSYEDFELIIVDDGSTDTTPQLCDEAAERDLRIHVLHQKNSGQARARNNGVNIACGDYITFIDSDDRVEPYYLEYLVKAIQQDQVDIACGGVDRVREGYELNPSVACFRLEYFDRKTALQEMLTDKKIGVGPCCRLVRREWQLENPFIDNTLYEDLSNTYKTYLLAERVAFVDAYLYHYVMRGGSTTGQRSVSKKQCEDYFTAISLCRDGVLNVYPDLKKDTDVCAARDYMSLYLSLHRCPDRQALSKMEEEILLWMRKNWISAASNPKAPLNVRLRLLLFRISPRLYEHVYYLGIRLKGKAIR